MGAPPLDWFTCLCGARFWPFDPDGCCVCSGKLGDGPFDDYPKGSEVVEDTFQCSGIDSAGNPTYR